MIQLHNDSPANGSPEKDAALGLVSDVAQEIDPLMEKRVLRKIDIFLMPAMLIGKSCLGSSVAYFSKNILADWVQVMVLYTMIRYDRAIVFLSKDRTLICLPGNLGQCLSVWHDK